jgi:hypothetical protein
MRAVITYAVVLIIGIRANAQTGKVGINTTMPQAMLHVKDSSVLFTGPNIPPATPGDPPVSGDGARMMWYADKSAFRVGYVNGNHWDKDSVGRNSFAAGQSPKAIGESSVAMGFGTIASATASTATGYKSIASGFASTAMGGSFFFSGNLASGDFSTAMGTETVASGTSSIAMGRGTRASGNHSITMGSGTYAKAYSSLSIGRFNDSINTSSKIAWVATDPVLIIGNGIADYSRSNAFIVTKNARTGINVANGLPGALLHLKAFESNFDMHIKLEDQNSADYAAIVYDGDMKFKNFGANDSYLWRDATNATRMHLTSTGNLSIDGTLSQSSDARLKTNIIPLQNSLQKITSLTGYNYNWIDEGRDKKIQTGILAQEVEKQMPGLVAEDANGNKSVNYNGLIPYLIESVKELKRENEKLKAEMETLRKVIGS